MKKIVNILASMLALVAMTSCEDLLEEKNYGNPTVESMMSAEENVVLLVGQAYADTKWLHDHWGYWGVASLTSDECVCPVRMPGEHWKDNYYWTRLNNHNWNWMGDAFKNIWNTTISGAVLCNKLLTTLADAKESMKAEVYAQYVGELEVLRSYYYYMLFDCFGRIPYLEEFVDKTEPLMEPEQVWSHLVNCLERNAPNMAIVTDANRAANYGRVTQGFAYALLARLYLNAESFGCTPENIGLANNKDFREDFVSIQSPADFYTNAVNCCDKVINAGSYSIEDDWFANFKIDNSASKENIFVIVENGNGEFDLRYIGSMSNKLRVPILTLHYSHQSVYSMVEKPWNGFAARPGFMERYNEKDLRGPGPIPPAAPEPPARPAKMTDAELAEYNKKLEAEYHGPLKEYAKTVQGYGTQSAKQWGWFIGPVFDKNGEIILDENKIGSICRIEIASLEAANWYDGARCTKYEVDKAGQYQYAENDFVLMRYADVLWMKEEAILRGGAGTSGFNTPDFQKMLTRTMAYEQNPKEAFATAYPGVVTLQLEDILDERGREFAWECVRRRDLIRFGKFADSDYVDYVTAKQKFREWFPIPVSYTHLDPDLRWEKKYEYNIGFDYAFWNNRIYGSLDTYYRQTRDLLWDYEVPTPPYQYTTLLANAGQMDSYGAELAINVVPVRTKQFSWVTTPTIAYNKNYITKLSDPSKGFNYKETTSGGVGENGIMNTNTQILTEGHPVGAFYGYKFAGFKKDGTWMFQTPAGGYKDGGTVSEIDRQVIGSAQPWFTFGWNNMLKYKNFDLALFFRGVVGNKILNLTRWAYGPQASQSSNVFIKDAVCSNVIYSDKGHFSDYYLEDGSYVKLDNVTLGYNFKPKSNKYVENMRVYFTGQNLLTLTKYSGQDPEVNTTSVWDAGIDYCDFYPTVANFLIGVNISLK